ncbi:hypothetical protein BAU15_08030 [Enterococcus sp. JM4C]|uniref:ROK family protein n=1 Tax=Candidatus Enterococcus huntleyi TaxID=1857217 RepID=UPI00137954E0|nr:ROK family protein [Enterococcus sp. JM4C]KAF1297843.1 hypothetical protein BAU15_08030 [Enterococcus sp. JM4C]
MSNYLCIDIGGTAIKYGLFDGMGNKLAKFEADKTDNRTNENGILMTICAKISDIMMDHPLAGICVSSAGVVNQIEGKIIYSGYTIPNYTGTEIKKTLENRFSIPCEVENDVNAACLGEHWKGALRGIENGVCLTVGTGVGGAILLDGDIYHGTGFTAGEVGYLTVDGTNFQDLASTSALVTRVSKKKGKLLTGEEIFILATSGDEECLSEIEVLVDSLSTGIVNIMYLLNPECLVLGGGIMAQEEFLKEKILNTVSHKIQHPIFNQTRIKFAELKNDAGMVGALYNFKKRQSVRR